METKLNNVYNLNLIDRKKTDKIRVCAYCFIPRLKKDIIKCCKCKTYLCKKCLTFVSSKAYCNNCLADFVKNDTLLIITKSGVEK